jgi:hypothetical protein
MIKDLKIDSPKNRERNLTDFESLLKHPGWLLVESIVELNIELLREQLEDGVGEETLESVRRIRDKIKIHKDVINTPRVWINRLKPGIKQEEHNDDPY